RPNPERAHARQRLRGGTAAAAAGHSRLERSKGRSRARRLLRKPRVLPLARTRSWVPDRSARLGAVHANDRCAAVARLRHPGGPLTSTTLTEWPANGKSA